MSKCCTTSKRQASGAATHQSRLSEEERDALARIGKALSDPTRLEMLDLLAQGRSCCEMPDPAARGVPGAGEPPGICVCEFQEQFGLGQSRVSYHLGVLREAGLVTVEGRGKWSFYAIDREALTHAHASLAALFGAEGVWSCPGEDPETATVGEEAP
jgi:ArsR family transcriptional regulator